MLLLLTKQTGAIGYGVCWLWAMWVVLVKERYWKGAALLAAGGACSVALTIGIWGMLAGSVGVALSALHHSLHPSAEGKAYIEEVSSGPWYRFFYLLWVVGPLTAVLALVGGFIAGAIVGGVVGAILGVLGLPVKVISIITGFLGFVVGLVVSYFCFRLTIAKFLAPCIAGRQPDARR